MRDVVPRMRPRDVFGVRLSVSALDFPADGTNTRVSPHDLSYAGDMQEYGTGIAHLSYAGIGWFVEEISTTPAHSQLKFCIGLFKSLFYILVNACVLDICILTEPVDTVTA